jgi:hypothetical protein
MGPVSPVIRQFGCLLPAKLGEEPWPVGVHPQRLDLAFSDLDDVAQLSS